MDENQIRCPYCKSKGIVKRGGIFKHKHTENSKDTSVNLVLGSSYLKMLFILLIAVLYRQKKD